MERPIIIWRYDLNGTLTENQPYGYKLNNSSTVDRK